jgi:hypothetical protein
MAEDVYTSRIRVERVNGPIRHAFIAPFEQPVRARRDQEVLRRRAPGAEEVPATLDYMIAAVGG